MNYALEFREKNKIVCKENGNLSTEKILKKINALIKQFEGA